MLMREVRAYPIKPHFSKASTIQSGDDIIDIERTLLALQ
jgi:hypothetical protein